MLSSISIRMLRIYRALFVLLDIALPIMGICINTFAPVSALQNFTPRPTTPINLETFVLLDCTSGFFAALAFINIYLLCYRPNDLVVWRGLIAGVLLQDLFMLGGFLRELRLRDGGAAVADWTVQDWGNIGGYTAIAIARVFFVAGVGLGGQKYEKDEKEL